MVKYRTLQISLKLRKYILFPNSVVVQSLVFANSLLFYFRTFECANVESYINYQKLELINQASFLFTPTSLSSSAPSSSSSSSTNATTHNTNGPPANNINLPMVVNAQLLGAHQQQQQQQQQQLQQQSSSFNGKIISIQLPPGATQLNGLPPHQYQQHSTQHYGQQPQLNVINANGGSSQAAFIQKPPAPPPLNASLSSTTSAEPSGDNKASTPHLLSQSSSSSSSSSLAPSNQLNVNSPHQIPQQQQQQHQPQVVVLGNPQLGGGLVASQQQHQMMAQHSQPSQMMTLNANGGMAPVPNGMMPNSTLITSTIPQQQPQQQQQLAPQFVASGAVGSQNNIQKILVVSFLCVFFFCFLLDGHRDHLSLKRT